MPSSDAAALPRWQVRQVHGCYSPVVYAASDDRFEGMTPEDLLRVYSGRY